MKKLQKKGRAPTKVGAKRKPGKVEVLPPEKKRKASTCECGKTNTDEPLDMCVTCAECGTWLHSKADIKKHESCLELLAKKEPPPVVEESEAPKRGGGRRVKTEVMTEATTSAEPAWEIFFRCQRHPVLRSQVLTALMAGTQVEAARIPKASLLDMVLLATASREYLAAEIVDDYEELLRRTAEEWARPDWSCRVFSQQHANWANWILNGKHTFDTVEEAYIPSLTKWYIEQNTPEYFAREITDAAPAKARRGGK